MDDIYGKGYRVIQVYGRKKKIAVHQLVATAWNGEPPTPDHKIVEHRDGSRQNNHAENVRWATHSDNLNSALRLGEREKHYPVKLSEYVVYHIRTKRDRDEIAELAEELGTGEQTIRDVFDNNTWKHVRLDQPRLF
jgi:hypothetical protein